MGYCCLLLFLLPVAWFVGVLCLFAVGFGYISLRFCLFFYNIITLIINGLVIWFSGVTLFELSDLCLL